MGELYLLAGSLNFYKLSSRTGVLRTASSAQIENLGQTHLTWLPAGGLDGIPKRVNRPFKFMVEFNNHMQESGEPLHWLENGCADLSNMVSCLNPTGRVRRIERAGVTLGIVGARSYGRGGRNYRRERKQGCFTRTHVSRMLRWFGY